MNYKITGRFIAQILILEGLFMLPAAAISAGIVAGDADKELEVISCVPQEKHAQIKAYMETADLEIQPAYSDLVFDIDLFVYGGDDMVRLRIANHHTNVVLIQRNNEVAAGYQGLCVFVAVVGACRCYNAASQRQQCQHERYNGMQRGSGAHQLMTVGF